MADITVTESDRAPGHFDVAVVDGGRRHAYRVTVPSEMSDQLTGVEPSTLVRESFVFLLEREPATSILPEFSLSVISRYFPEYVGEMQSRLG